MFGKFCELTISSTYGAVREPYMDGSGTVKMQEPKHHVFFLMEKILPYLKPLSVSMLPRRVTV
jgi:hypothetical protein